MAFNFNKFNKGTKICRPEVDNSEYDFVGLSSFAGEVIRVDGFFFTNGEYGEQVCVIGEGVNINMPGRAVEDFHALAEDADAVEAVLNGELILTDIHLIAAKSKAKKDTYSYTFGNVANLK